MEYPTQAKVVALAQRTILVNQANRSKLETLAKHAEQLWDKNIEKEWATKKFRVRPGPIRIKVPSFRKVKVSVPITAIMPQALTKREKAWYLTNTPGMTIDPSLLRPLLEHGLHRVVLTIYDDLVITKYLDDRWQDAMLAFLQGFLVKLLTVPGTSIKVQEICCDWSYHWPEKNSWRDHQTYMGTEKEKQDRREKWAATAMTFLDESRLPGWALQFEDGIATRFQPAIPLTESNRLRQLIAKPGVFVRMTFTPCAV